jgi:hypothetical protein
MPRPVRVAARNCLAVALGLAAVVLVARPVEAADSYSYSINPAHGQASASVTATILDDGSTACTNHWVGFFEVILPDGGAEVEEAGFSEVFRSNGQRCEANYTFPEAPWSTPGTYTVGMTVSTAGNGGTDQTSGSADYTVDSSPTSAPTPLPTPTPASTPTARPTSTPHATSEPSTTSSPSSGSSSQPGATSTASTSPVPGQVAATTSGASGGGIPGWLLALVAVLVLLGATGGAYYIGAHRTESRPAPPQG